MIIRTCLFGISLAIPVPISFQSIIKSQNTSEFQQIWFGCKNLEKEQITEIEIKLTTDERINSILNSILNFEIISNFEIFLDIIIIILNFKCIIFYILNL